MKTYIGLNNNQFQQVLQTVMPMMRPSFRNPETQKLALYIYLLKLRTNHTLAQIAPHFNLSEWTVGSWVKKMRKIVHKALVPEYLYNVTRAELLRNTTALSRKIYEVDDARVVVTFDATYVFTVKSSNYEFQKKSYSKQFARNLVKFMLCVTTNGLIAAAYGPFEAKENDATILDKILHEQGNIFQKLRAGDVVVVDRGFRDVSLALRNRGFIVKVPKGIKKKTNNKLTRNETNESRLVTKTRFVIEVRNSHIKNIWKSLNGTKIHQSIPYLKMDFQVATALVNAFCRKIVSDVHEPNIGDLMLSRRVHQNILSSIVHNIPDKVFRDVQNLSLHPKYTYAELKKISFGSYQIRLAGSYCQAHVKMNNNAFVVKVCDQVKLCKQYCGKLLTRQSKPLLLSLKLQSRFSSGKTHKPYVLLDFVNGKFAVKAYCCSCRHGCRTIGCCSHVMVLIWFTLGIEPASMTKFFRSTKLDHIFDDWADEYSVGSHSDFNVSTDSSLNLSTDSSLNLNSDLSLNLNSDLDSNSDNDSSSTNDS